MWTSHERQGKEGADLDAAVAAAADKQAAKAATQDVVLAQDIETAPAAELASGDGDVSTTGAGLMAPPDCRSHRMQSTGFWPWFHLSHVHLGCRDVALLSPTSASP